MRVLIVEAASLTASDCAELPYVLARSKSCQHRVQFALMSNRVSSPVAAACVALSLTLKPALLLPLALATAPLVVGCTPKNPTVTPRVARVTGVSSGGLTLAVELDVYNPNSFPLIAQFVEGAVTISNGAELGRGSAAPQSSIPANGRALVSAQMTVPWANLGALAPFALSPNPVPYTFRGDATIGGDSLNVKVPFEVTGQLTREQLLQAGLRGL